jgi:hypothetical protein
MIVKLNSTVRYTFNGTVKQRQGDAGEEGWGQAQCENAGGMGGGGDIGDCRTNPKG